ncbi:unnamed protein product [Candidula unifasciata]|uniref:protein-glutamine gamma-glutamyltransferase n=1 Tax=Candidula unifasciata TaxID=100452 RepID=A0A8S3ZXC4_9EUPU|nr:unnamed protein product [Candidula unifasciata]
MSRRGQRYGRTPGAPKDPNTTASGGGGTCPTTFGSGGNTVCTQTPLGWTCPAHVIDYGEGATKPCPTSGPDPKKVLTVIEVDFKIEINSKAHHTNKFAVSRLNSPNPQLVVRRGQPFAVTVTFSRPYDEKTDDLKLVFETGDTPVASKRTYVEFILSDEDIPNNWGGKIESRQGNTITMDIFTPSNCFVAKWTFKIDVVKKEDRRLNVYRYNHKNPIYILFNPWCKDDVVHMTEEKLLDEYILNETGIIFCGTSTSITSKPWNFGQFESCILDVTMYLLDNSGLNWAVRGQLIPIVRKLSALVNSSDEGGIVFGKWEGSYEDGTAPLAWTGSVAILEEYWRTKRPVKYGQCWVFAGVATTVCRVLGIPARVVTNYSSAHDTDGTITIDYHMTAEDEMDASMNTDSVWNFHVWTEIWSTRPDLPPGYGGWQVIDATPQEASDGIYCCGPASVIAVQHGEVNLPYDGPFVFAEVNADTVYWQPNQRGVYECVYMDKKKIGKFISTKAPNSNEREDITHKYKHEEDTPEERSAVIRANLVSAARHDLYKPTSRDVQFSIEQDSANTKVGGNFVVGLRMKNNSQQKRTMKGRIAVSTMFYTGITADTLKSEPFLVNLKPGEETVKNVEVTPEEYDGHLKDGCMIDVSIMAHVEETSQNFAKKMDYRLHKPHLTAKAPAEVKENEEFKLDVSFTNPLNMALTQCGVTVDGVAIRRTFQQGNVPPHGTFSASLPVQPEKTGQGDIIIIFNSRELEDINTSIPIFVRGH